MAKDKKDEGVPLAEADQPTKEMPVDPAPPADPPADVPPADTPPAEAQPPAPATEAAKELDPEEFREQQRVAAASQNLTQPNAVPEQRPQAFLETPVATDPLTEQMRERGAFADEEPMPPEAFVQAASEEQMKAAAEESREEQIHPGVMIRVKSGPHEGRFIAVTRVLNYEDSADLAVVTAGVPEARFVKAKEIEGRARGDSRDGEVVIINTDEHEVEIVRDWRGTGRG